MFVFFLNNDLFGEDVGGRVISSVLVDERWWEDFSIGRVDVPVADGSVLYGGESSFVDLLEADFMDVFDLDVVEDHHILVYVLRLGEKRHGYHGFYKFKLLWFQLVLWMGVVDPVAVKR